MPFASIRTVSFRNLVDEEVNLNAPEVFLIGENGQGKTNFLEAVYFCSYASSFRVSKDSELISRGHKSLAAHAQLSDNAYDSIQIRLENAQKKVFMNNKRIEDRKELLNVVPSVVFCHEDMDFISGPPERRRWFFDQSLSLYDPLYVDDLRRFRKVLKTRNTVLKNSDASLLDLLDEQLVSYGIELMKKRRLAAISFSQAFGPLYEKVSGISDLAVKYLSSWKTEDTETEILALSKRRDTDLGFGTTMSGPHRDRYQFTKSGQEFSASASTGQRRLLALLLRSAQALRYTEASGKKPVLLLDDVLLELDPEKRRRFLSELPDYDQALFTFLPGEPYERYAKEKTMVYTVAGGTLSS
ncbi:DNA replication and repair protein RecF [Treponema sp.]